MLKRCIDCLHEAACREIYDTAGLTFDAECPNMDQLCLHFADKELNASFPCKPGSVVYSAVGFNNRPEKSEEYTVEEIRIGPNNEMLIVICDRVGFQRFMKASDIGVIVFLNKDDAMKEYERLMEGRKKPKVSVKDTLYVLTSDSLTGIEETHCSRIKTKTLQDVGEVFVYWAPCVHDDWGGARWEFYDWDFGSKVFTTREEAEKKLSEGANNG